MSVAIVLLPIVAVLVGGISANVVFSVPVRIDTHAYAGTDSKGMLGIGSEGDIDGDAVIHLKQYFENHRTPTNGVGNAHGLFSGITIGNTGSQAFTGQAMSVVGEATLRSTNRADLTGNLYGVAGMVQSEAGAQGAVAHAHAIQADGIFEGARIKEYVGLYSRQPGGAAVVDKAYGVYIEAMSRGTFNRSLFVGGGTSEINGELRVQDALVIPVRPPNAEECGPHQMGSMRLWQNKLHVCLGGVWGTVLIEP